MSDANIGNVNNEDTSMHINGDEEGNEISVNPLFLKLREQSIIQVTNMMESTIKSMQRLERSMERIGSATSGVTSTARIWSSFYDPMVVEKLKQESTSKIHVSETNNQES